MSCRIQSVRGAELIAVNPSSVASAVLAAGDALGCDPRTRPWAPAVKRLAYLATSCRLVSSWVLVEEKKKM